jgi:hypothetical protein
MKDTSSLLQEKSFE